MNATGNGIPHMSDPAPTGEARSAAASRWRDLGVRSLTAAVLIPLVILVTWAGGLWFAALIGAGGLLMAHEWCRMVHGGALAQLALHGGAGLLAAGMATGLVTWPVLIAGLALAWAASLVLAWRTGGLSRWVVTGVAYVALPVVALGLLRQGEAGLTAVLWVMLSVWAADIGAYFAGRIIGGPKLAPKISPNKTWAGLGGAMGGAMLASLAVWLTTGLANPAMALVLGGLVGLFEQMGDLFESAAKRRFGRKDSGTLIPGHGGILDRVDGLVAASVLAAVIGAVHAGVTSTAQGLLQW